MKSISPQSPSAQLRVFIALLLFCLLLIEPLVPLAAPGKPPVPSTPGSTAIESQPVPAQTYVANQKSSLAADFYNLFFTAAGVSATMKDIFTDADGDSKADIGQTITYETTFTNNTGANVTGLTFQDTPDSNTALVAGSIHASPVAFDHTYNWVGNTVLDTQARALASITSNAVAPTDSFTLSTTPTSGPSHGSVTISPNGHFIYTPDAGYTGDDAFAYTISNTADNSLTSTATVTIHMPVRVWYVQNAAVNGNGRSNTPFNSPASVSTAANAATDIIYLFSDIGANSKVNGNFALDNGQQLLGQGVNLVANSITLFTANSAPTITNSSGNGITLAAGASNTISGLVIGNCSGSAIASTSPNFGTLNLSSLSINTTGQALNLSSGAIAGTGFTSITSSGGTNNVSLTFITGNLSLGSGALSGASGTAFSVSGAGSTATISYSGNISKTSAGRIIDIQNHSGTNSITLGGNMTCNSGCTGANLANNSGGTIEFSGSAQTLTTQTSNGVTLTNNGGASIFFTGGNLDVVTTSGKAFTATGGGTIKVTGSGNTLTTESDGAPAGGMILEITDTIITTGGLNFISLTGHGGSSTARGVHLKNAGSGGLTVTGTGATAGSGGTITNYVQQGVKVESTNNISLSNMNFTGNGTANLTSPGGPPWCGDAANGANGSNNCAAGIDLQTVNTASLTRVHVAGGAQMGINGNTVTDLVMNTVEVNNVGNEILEDGIQLVNLITTSQKTWTDLNIHDNAARQLEVQNSSGTNNILINKSAGGTLFFGNSVWPGPLTSSQGILWAGHGTANVTVSIQNATFARNFGSAFHSDVAGSASANCTINGGAMIDNGLVWEGGGIGTGNYTYTLTNVGTIWADPAHTNSTLIGVLKGSGASGLYTGNISNNVFGLTSVSGTSLSSVSGTAGPCDGCPTMAITNGGTSGTHNLNISGNTVRHTQNGVINITSGINGPNDSGFMNVSLTGNTFTDPDESDNDLAVTIVNGTAPGDTSKTCANITGNTITDPVGGGSWNSSALIRLRHVQNNQQFRLPGYAGGATDTTAVANFLNANNTLSSPDTSAAISLGSGTFVGGAACFLLLALYDSISPDEPLSRQIWGGAQFPSLNAFAPASQVGTFNQHTDNAFDIASINGATPAAQRNIVASLGQEQLDSAAAAAIERWSATQLTPQQLATLRAIKFEVADLSGVYLGEAEGNRILVDRDAGGLGWYVGSDARSDLFFGRVVSLTRRYAEPQGAPVGSLDLLTAVAHEMGHHLKLDDTYSDSGRDDLMYGYLTPGERRMPAMDQALSASSNRLYSRHFLSLSNTAERTSGTDREPLRKSERGTAPANHNIKSGALGIVAAPPVPPVNVSIGTLPNARTIKIRFQVTVNNSLPNSVTQVQTQGIFSGSFGSQVTNDPDTVTADDMTITQIARSDLSLTKTDNVIATTPGSTLTYTLSYSNPGRSATGVVLTETLPTGTTFNAADSDAEWLETPSGSGIYKLTLGSLSSGTNGTKAFSVMVTNPAAAGLDNIANTATIADDGSYELDINAANNTATDTDVLNASPAFTLSKSDGATSITPGSTLTYTLNYSNTGDQNGTGVVLTETVPAGTTFNSGASTAGWTETPSGSGIYKLNIGNLAGGAAGSGSATFVVTVNNPASAALDSIINNASITDDGTNSASAVTTSASDTDTLNAAPDLTLGKTPDVSSASPGQTIIYTLNYSNAGNQSATGVIITETVPANTTFTTVGSSAGWSCANNSPAGSTCTNNIGGLAAGVNGALMFAVTVVSPLSSGVTQISNTAAIADNGSNGADTNISNNSTGAVITPVCSNPATVTNTNDGGPGSLRQAIMDVCEGGTVNFNISGAGPHTITLSSGEITIGKNLTMTGAVDKSIIVSGGNSSRIFNVSAGKTVQISNLNIHGGSAASSGAIWNSGTLLLTGMAIYGNISTGEGGAIRNDGILTIYNSTLSGNSAGTDGGAILTATGSTTTLLSVTITNNTATGTGGGLNNSGTLKLKNAIVAGNSASSDPNIFQAGVGSTNDQGNNILTGDPKLGALSFNGGPTKSHLLLTDSPALDAGDSAAANAAGLTTDQRGPSFPRIADSADANSTATVDIGAFELHPSVEEITDKSTNEDTPISFGFNVGDDTAGIASVTATSGNTGLVPNDPVNNLAVTGSGSTRTLTITPAADAFGQTLITLTVTTTNGQVASDTFTLTVGSVNDTPTITTNSGITLNEGSIGNTVTGTELKVEDADNSAAQLIYTISTPPTNGTLRKSGVPLVNASTFTQEEINNSLVTYDHDGSETTSDSFTFVVADGNGGALSSPQTFNISVTPQNDVPAIVTNTGLTITPGASGTVDNTRLLISDPDNTAAQLIFTVGNVPAHGQLKKSGVGVSTGSTFTQEDINNNLITFTHNGDAATSDSVTFTVADGAGGTIGTTTLSISINCVASSVVTNTNDSGVGSLREAIITSCPGNVIIFNIPTDGSDPGYDSSTGILTITLTTGELVVDRDLTITGPGANVLVLKRSASGATPRFRIFGVAATAITVNINGMTISNGHTPDGASGVAGTDGGAILNNTGATLNLKNVSISGNFAGNGGGGAAGGSGGGIKNMGTLNLANSTLSNNTAGEGGANAGGGSGGGIYNSGAMTLTNVTLSDNAAGSANSNGAGGDGGALYNSGGTLNLVNNTISSNTTGAGSSPSTGGSGGGVRINGGTVNARNSIIAGNSVAAGGQGADVSGVINSQDYNLIGSTSGASFTGTTTHNILNLNPGLGGLADNGAQTQTMLPLPGSPALGAGEVTNLPSDAFDLDGDGNTAEALPIDQRGFARVIGANFDIGAIEANYTITATSGTPQSAVINTPFPTNLQAIVKESNIARSNLSVTFTAPASGASGAFASNSTVITDAGGMAVAPAFTANAIAGGPYNVTASLSGNSPSVNFALTNTKAEQTIHFGSLANKTFGDSPFSVSATAGSGLVVSFSSLTGSVCSVSGSNVTILRAGTCTIRASQAGNSNFNPAPNVDGSFTIAKANQVITFNAPTDKTFGDAAFNVSATGGASGNPVAFSSQSSAICSVSSNTVTILAAGTCTIRASQEGDSNYEAAPDVSRSFNIAKAVSATTITISNAVFDGNPHGGTAVVKGVGGLNQVLTVTYTGRDTTPYGPSAIPPTNAGDYKASATFNGDASYAGSSDSKDFQITKANQTITFNALGSKTVGDADFNISATASSGLAVSFAASGQCTVNGNTVHITSAGSCTITASQTGNANYNSAASVPQGFQIEKANQTITFNLLANKTFGDVDFAVNATASSSLTVSFATSGQCTIVGNTVHITGAGSCTIEASQAGDNNFNAAANVQRDFQIAKAASATAITSSLNPSEAGQSVTFTATVISSAGAPAGTVQFKDNGTNLGAPVALNESSVATFQTSVLSGGTHTVTAEYSGDANYTASTGTLSGGQVVNIQASTSINDLSFTEGDAGAKSFEFTVTLSSASNLTVEVDFVTANGTATAGSDYQTASGTLTFTPGELTKTITVLVNGDVVNEPNETFFVNLSNARNSTITDNQGLGTVLNDDAPGVQFSANSFNISEGIAGGFGTLTVSRTGDISQPMTVDYMTSDQSAMAPCQTNNNGFASDRCDYATAAGTLQFAAGEASKAISIVIVNDGYVEPSEQLTVKLLNVQGGAPGTPDTATVTITDDDTQAATTNPIDVPDFFLFMQYMDFMGRVPDPAGFQFWKDRMSGNCPAGQICDRTDTSFRFFESDEFRERGYFIYLFYHAGLGRRPTYREWIQDVSNLNGYKTVEEQEAAKEAFVQEFISRQEFMNLYNQHQTGESFVNAMIQRTGVTPANSQAMIQNYPSLGRAKVLRVFMETPEVQAAYFDRAFVTMLYFGYLRRDAEPGGFAFWMQRLNETNKDYRFLIDGFLNSDEYRFRYAFISLVP